MTPKKQLDLRARHPDFQQFLDVNEKESVRVRATYPCFLDQAYGEDQLQTLDVFPAKEPNSPILVFIHGGYWRALDKKSYSFVAEPFLQNGFAVCVVNYRLIPSVNMAGLLGDIRSGLDWIQREARRMNGNPNALVLSGHSAGGHLALAIYLLHEDLRPDIRALCSLSGLFDLKPIQESYLNEVLDLQDSEVEAFSVSNQDLSQLRCPTLLSVGGGETELFIAESRGLYDRNQSNAHLSYDEYPDLNHYQIVHKLGKAGSPLVQFIFDNCQ